MKTRPKIPPRPDRVRRIQGTPFGWVDARLLRQGWLSRLSPEAIAAYAFLCLAADRQGLSYYRRDRIAAALALDETEVYRALKRLRELDLVAFRPFHPGAVDGFHQVLALPGSPPSASETLQTVADLGRCP